MRIAQVYNQQRSEFGGEEAVIRTVERVLSRHGHSTSLMMRSSRGTDASVVRKIRAAASGVYNPRAYAEMARFIERERPDVVHVHSVFPNLSPSVLAACRSAGVATIFHVHCHILTCPNWYHLRNGDVCNRCFGGHEHWCLLTNCRGSVPESAAYALRSFVSRKLSLFEGNVSLFVAVSHFLKDRLVSAGYDPDRIEVVRNAVRPAPSGEASGAAGEYVGYAGRLSPEKGVDTLIEAARICAVPVKIAGDGPEMERLRSSAPANVEFLGRVDASLLDRFYAASRIIAVPSRSYETFSLTVAEAMMHGKTVVASRIGALPELVGDDERGMLVTPNAPGELAGAMHRLWHDEPARVRLGEAARLWANTHCSEEVFYRSLLAVYERAISMARAGRLATSTSLQPGECVR
ncbi:MAG TPA: glycosyltransferase [Vicinamibacterales bacterium]|nr:glycosyltransferase [Vicinamibacterales bacterium]